MSEQQQNEQTEEAVQADTVTEAVETTPSENELAAKAVVTKYMGWGAGAGAMPVPFWDVVAIGSVQVLMLKEIFAVYEVDYHEKKLRSAVTLLLGSLSPGMLAGATASTFLKVVPGLGGALAAATLPILASASTYAVGKVMIGHLENGGTLENFKAGDYKEKFNESVEKGKEILKRKKAEKEATTAKEATA